MPETRTERAIFVLGLIAIAALGLLVARLWHHNHGVAAVSTISLSRPAPTTVETLPAKSLPPTTETRTTERARTTTTANTHRTRTSAPSAAGVSLLVTAKADTWLEIRSGSSTGSLLYRGTLGAASTKTFRAKVLWARFGAAANLSARLDGRSIRLPSGTYDATFDRHGFRQVGA